MSQIVNRRDLSFHLYHVENLQELFNSSYYGAHDKEIVDASLDTAEKIAEDYYLPIAAELDANEPSMRPDGTVDTLPAVAEGINAFKEAGFFAANFAEELGGAQLPYMVTNPLTGMFTAANAGMAGYQFLTVGAANMLAAVGSEAQKATYLPPMLAGDWFGTMCLSEPQAGSSLADITTKATPTGEGHYLIQGTKMWISGGEQEISENIVHMVLAKIPGGPEGVKGISLFIVPKYRVNADGSVGAKNNIALAGLNHKMGQRGLSNTLLNFGEAGDCHGYLVGEPHKGLMYMFHMMNEARIGVGFGATMSALAGYLYSLQYAKDRPQGRDVAQKDPATKQISIIEHADIKRLLLAQKSAVEGALSLLIYCSGLLDRQLISDSSDEKQALGLLLDLLTPIAKSWPSEFCLEANKHAIQILGGYGYTREYPVERHYRDNRLNPIHEGTHGIQGIDLLGRKVTMADGAALKLLLAEMDKTLADAANHAELADLTAAVSDYKSHMADATMKVLTSGKDPKQMLANATLYLDAMGHGVIAWMWLRQAIAAHKDQAELDADFVTGKLTAARYFMVYELPKGKAWLDLVASMDDTCLNMPEAAFL